MGIFEIKTIQGETVNAEISFVNIMGAGNNGNGTYWCLYTRITSLMHLFSGFSPQNEEQEFLPLSRHYFHETFHVFVATITVPITSHNGYT